MRSEHLPKRARSESGIDRTPCAKTRRARCPGGWHGSPAAAASFGGRARAMGGVVANAGINFWQRVLIILFTEEK